MPKHSQSVDKEVRKSIYAHGRGWVFSRKYFQDLGSSAAVESTLRRLKKEGFINPIARGLYIYPSHDPDFGVLSPTPDAIARALAGRDAIRLQPSGAYAANVLGLSEQVPSRIVFLTDGPSKKVQFGKQEIILQKTVPKNVAAAGRKSGTLIQALRYLGADQVDDSVREILQRQILPDEYAAIRSDLQYAPAWVADILRSLTEPVA